MPPVLVDGSTASNVASARLAIVDIHPAASNNSAPTHEDIDLQVSPITIPWLVATDHTPTQQARKRFFTSLEKYKLNRQMASEIELCHPRRAWASQALFQRNDLISHWETRFCILPEPTRWIYSFSKRLEDSSYGVPILPSLPHTGISRSEAFRGGGCSVELSAPLRIVDILAVTPCVNRL